MQSLTEIPKLEGDDFALANKAGWFFGNLDNKLMPLFQCPYCYRHLDLKNHSIDPTMIKSRCYGSVSPNFRCKCNRFDERMVLANWPAEYKKPVGELCVRSLKADPAPLPSP